MANFFNRFLTVESRIFFQGFFVVFIVFVIIPIGSLVIWHMLPTATIGLTVIDKTVPNQLYQEHQSIHWLLNHFKFTKNDGGVFDGSKDYFGFFPGSNPDEYHINDLAGKTETEIQKILYESQMVYLADTYGVYENDLKEKYEPTPSKKIYGGMEKADIDFLKKAYLAEIDIIAEFNSIASPTSKQIRKDFENLVGIKWTGWIARYFDELDTMKNAELPSWLVEGYKLQHNKGWDFSGPAMVFLHENGQIEILKKGMELKKEVPEIMSGIKSQDTFHLPEIVKYPYWIEINFLSRDYEVVSYFDLEPTESGIKKLEEMGLPRYFPAVVIKKNGKGKFYYFCGDFADNPVSGSTYNFYGMEKLWRLFLHPEDYSNRASFFWNYYYPLMESILSDTHHRSKEKEGVN